MHDVKSYVLRLLCIAALIGSISCNVYDRPAQQDRWGDMNDGRWWCSWRTSWGSCWDGEFYCKCPGRGNEVYFKVGCCYEFPACGVICHNHDCSKYYNCDECRTNIGEWDSHSCQSCKAGFVLGSAGDCKTDYDECSFLNGNCDHACHNTYGSYHCSCFDGHRLNSDGRSCERLSCEAPNNIAHGSVVATENWMYNSYAKYACSDLYKLLGPAHIQCIANKEDLYWQHEQPKCTDICDNVPLEQRTPCGSATITVGQCNELGCCYRQSTQGGPNCFRTPVPLYLSYIGDKPTPNNGEGFQALPDYDMDGCSITCSYGSNLRCKSFVTRLNNFDENHGVQRRNCYLQDKSRRQFSNDGELEHNVPDTILYDQLNFLSASKRAETKAVSLEDKLYIGCFGDKETRRDLEYFVWMDYHNTPAKCINACRQQGFLYAGLQDMFYCYCGNGVTRIYEESTTCTRPCSGDQSVICGGESANSVYHVPADSRYLGCYNDASADRDLPVMMWTAAGSRNSATACVAKCRDSGFGFAGVQNGGSCYCGDSFGRHGAADEESCSERCDGGWIDENCGGENANAIYVTEKGMRPEIDLFNPETTKLYFDDERLTGIPLTLFTAYPNLKSVISKRLIIHATEKVYSPAEDRACWMGCYTKCGEIYHPPGLDYKGKDLVLRFFFLNLKNLQSYVGLDAERVYVYAQTLLIEDSVSFSFSLQLRARQIIINRGTAHMIQVGSSSPLLDQNFEIIKDTGPDNEFLFTKQSFMCARILLDTRIRENANVAWAILYDLRDQLVAPQNVEKYTWAQNIRMFNSFLSGMDRNNVYFVPFYSKSYFSEMLRLYYNQISIYKDDYDRLLDSAISDAEYYRTVQEMLTIHTTTDVAEAQSSFDAALNGVIRSNATYYRLKAEYDKSRAEMDAAQKNFEESLEKGTKALKSTSAIPAIPSSVLNWVSLLGKVFNAVRAIKAWKAQKDLEEALLVQIDMLAESMENLAECIAETERFMEMSGTVLEQLENPSSTYDFTLFMADIEITVAMQIDIIRWQNLKNDVIVILSHSEVNKFAGCAEYMRTVLNLINWGEAVTRSSVEHAEIMRDCIQRKYLLQSKKEQSARYAKYLQELQQGVITRQVMTMRMAEQQYDVRLDLNGVLESFCQAFFYENMMPCKDSYKPSFGGSLSELLLKINLALMDSILVPNPPSTVSRIVRITDTDTSPDCNDFINCPVRHFRDTGIFYYKLGIDHPSLRDLDQYRIHEIILDFVGATTNSSTFDDLLKVRIESSGTFKGRERRNVYDFLTRALSLTFEYSVVTGHISIRANVYEPFRDTVQHITPYTTWVIRLSELSTEINLTNVNMITMRLDGSAIDNETKNKLVEGQHPDKPIV